MSMGAAFAAEVVAMRRGMLCGARRCQRSSCAVGHGVRRKGRITVLKDLYVIVTFLQGSNWRKGVLGARYGRVLVC
jgi:hypothetical protein